MLNFLLTFVLTFVQPAFAGEIIMDRFLGLNEDSPATLTNQAQDLLNVETNIAGTALLKRKGFSRIASLTVTTAPINGSHTFIDPNGNKQDIVCHDHYCAKSTNNGAFSNFISTAGGAQVPTRWSFKDVNGILYGANDRRDLILRWNGTTYTGLAGVAQGSILELTKDRLVITDTSANPNRVHYSRSGSYEDFTTGLDDVSPYTDDMGTPGDRNTGLKYTHGKLFIFKGSSISGCIIDNQYNSQCFPISNTIGTVDPAGIVEAPDALYFRGQDRNYWRLDDQELVLISRSIYNLVQSQTSGSQQSNTQTTQSDWQAGTQSPSASWNTTAISGSVFPSSITFVDTSSTNFAAGNLANTSTNTVNGTLTLGYVVPNFGVESSTWGAGWVPNNTAGTSGQWTANAEGLCGSASAGTFKWGGSYTLYPRANGVDETFHDMRIQNAATSQELYIRRYDTTTESACAEASFDLSTQTVQMKIVLREKNSSAQNTITSVAFSSGTLQAGVLQYGSGVRISNDGAGSAYTVFFDFYDPYFVKAGTFTSQAFDTTYTNPVYGVFKATVTSNAWSSQAFKVNTSADGITWGSDVAVTSDLKMAPATLKFIRYVGYFSTSLSSKSVSVSDIELQAATTGQFTTQCIAPGSNISAWGILSCAQTITGGGTLTLAVATGTACGSYGVYTTIANNAAISVATAPAMVVRATSLLGSTTDQAQLDACTVYWNNGVVAPPVWGVYDSIRNAIYWAASINNSATNNRLLKYDLGLNEWFPFDIPAAALKTIGTSLYFGSSSGGYWNLYGGVDSDNGTAINAYWKSRDFTGGDPFVEKEPTRLSLVARNQVTGSVTTTLTNQNNSSSAFSISLSTTSGITYVRANYNLAKQSPFQFFNVKFGNNSSNPFEINGFKLDFNAAPWKPNNP